MTISAADVREQNAYGEPHEVVEGIFLVRMPLPFKLDHINVYLIPDNDGWTLIDTGMDTDHTKDVWTSLFSGFMCEYPLARIIITHHHPDHIGMAGWLQEQTGATVHISKDEIGAATNALARPDDDQQPLIDHYSRFGLDENMIEQMVAKGPSYKRLVKRLPVDTVRIEHDSQFDIGEEHWGVRVGRGHSPEHVCLWNDSNSVLISGDHVLPSISPNISIMVSGARDPLTDYLTTLSEFRELPVKVYLPSHGLPSSNYTERIDNLIKHHHKQLDQLEAFCDSPKTVYDCTLELYGKDLPYHQYGFAVGEAAAHLVYLAKQNRLQMDDADVWTFKK